eukprot:6932476-Ditylum_brightwellii.AAC.1
MWRKSIVTLAPDPGVALAVVLQTAATFQAAAALVLVLVLFQMTVSTVMMIITWRNPTWTSMKEMYLHPMTLIQQINPGAECDQANDDSGCKFDWYSHACIHQGKYRAYKAVETKLKVQPSNKKCMKHSH